MQKKVIHLDGVSVTLATEYLGPANWIGGELPSRQLRAAWLKLSNDDQPMNPRLVGKPGVGKTTLALCEAYRLKLPVYLMQGTSDTRPEDLIISPIINEQKSISYVASPLVSAMITGGVCILDEGNRMSEKCWASLAPLLDHRRYVDSIVSGLRVQAHTDFRFVATMNDDASVYDLPEYIQSRLCPQISLDFSDPETEAKIIRQACPYVENDMLQVIVRFLVSAHTHSQPHSVRDAIQIAKYASRLVHENNGASSSGSVSGAPEGNNPGNNQGNKAGNMTASFALREAIRAILGDEALALLPEDPGSGPKGFLRRVPRT